MHPYPLGNKLIFLSSRESFEHRGGSNVLDQIKRQSIAFTRHELIFYQIYTLTLTVSLRYRFAHENRTLTAPVGFRPRHYS